jgi:DNA-binding transcriptional regulator YhcF (GntR family)
MPTRHAVSHIPRQRQPGSHMPKHAVSHVEWELGPEILEPHSALPLFVQCAYLAFGVIAARHLEEGTPLPSDSALAARWGISRETVQRAYTLLEEQGIVRTRRGVGHYVAYEPQMRRVQVQTGSRIYARPPTPYERGDLTATPWGTPVLVVEEPGKHPVARDAISTIIYT